MATWLIFATWAENDEALWNSHWIAQETARLAPSRPRVVEREVAVRKNLEAALARGPASSMASPATIEGVAFFGHGTPHAVLGSDDKEALDLANVHLLERRWAHAFACHTGRALIPAALDADVFVGYDVAITVDWTLADLPAALRERVAALVTATTFALLRGVRSRQELQRCAQQAAEQIVEWVLENDEDFGAVQTLAEQLVESMVTSR
jgi:hypothetical protein